MKRMSTAKKISSNRLTAKRTRKDLKRRPHVKALKEEQKRINLMYKQAEAIRYFRTKYSKPVETEGNIL